MAPQDPGREAFLRDAGRLYDETVARAGPASEETFDDIEERGEAAGRELRRRLLALRLAAEEAKQPEVLRCPRCGQPMRRPQAAAARTLDTFSGPVLYAAFRRRGWLTGSSIIESTVKQVGKRVQGTEKLWGLPGVEQTLQVLTHLIADDGAWNRFWDAHPLTPLTSAA
jgi:hypothetical protein